MGQFADPAVRAAHHQPSVGDVDGGGEGVGADLHAGGLEVVEGAVGEIAPVADFAGDVVGDAADGEVRVGVGHHHGDLAVRVEFAGAERRADAGVTAADGDDALAGHRDTSVEIGESEKERGSVGVLWTPPPMTRNQAR